MKEPINERPAGERPVVLTPGQPRWFSDAERRFERNYNLTSFDFEHSLRNSGLFELESLVELSKRRPDRPDLVYCSNRQPRVGDRWDGIKDKRFSATESIANISENDSLVMLKHIESDSEFGPFVDGLMSTIIDRVGGKMRNDVLVGRGTILIASPGRVTSYHIDSDVNFLFQVLGDKSISVFDQTDRTLVTEQELERYYCGDPNGAQFKEARQAEGRTYDLRAGRGVHIPCMAPHWARNRDTPSVALSINFDLRSVSRIGRLYRLNSRLRRLGFKPTPPGQSASLDRVKLAALSGIAAVKGLRRAGTPGATPSA